MERTEAYQFTAHIEDASSMLQIEDLRKLIKYINRYSKTKFRVTLKPRGPRVAAALADGRHRRAYFQSLPLRHAERIDVYVHENRTW
jgi:hypothetical protein